MKTTDQIETAETTATVAVEQGLTLAHLSEGWDLSTDDYAALDEALGRRATPEEYAEYKAVFEEWARAMLEGDEPEDDEPTEAERPEGSVEK